MEPASALRKVRDLCADLSQHAQSTTTECSDVPASGQGISLLQAKSATLLRYNLNLLRLARARVLGKPIAPIAERLVSDWVALEKIRPLERRLRYQIDALLKSAASRNTDSERHRPDPSAVVVDSDDEDDEDGEDGVYRPPRIAEVVYDGDSERRKEREKRQKERARMRKVRSDGVREMLAEVQGRPELLQDDDLGGGRKSAAVRRLMKEDHERTKFEEDHFTRLTVTRKDKKRKRELESAMQASGMEATDEFAGLVAVADRVVSGKGSARDSGKGRVDRRREEEEEERVRALDELTESMNAGGGRKGSRSGKKRRKR